MKYILINVWRYSHFILAVSSLFFVFLATATGLILAFEPIQKKVQPFHIEDSGHVPLAQLIDSLLYRYDEIIEISTDENGFVIASVISMDEEADGEFYINPKNGKKIADIPGRNKFFEFVNNLHRSLFLKTTGRVLIGVTSFLLFLIAVTGLMLFIKRQGGIKHLFSKIVKEKSIQYYHVLTGRLMLIPIAIITLSGVYLSLFRFEIIPEAPSQNITYLINNTGGKRIPFGEFEIFEKTKIGAVQKLEFP
ncbi:MAG: PepSY-associated TM helix domain-containing protein, partial [Bacteroidota bacterium]